MVPGPIVVQEQWSENASQKRIAYTTTKELLEGDLFDKQNEDIEGFVTLVAQRRVARAKSNESSDQQENSY